MNRHGIRVYFVFGEMEGLGREHNCYKAKFSLLKNKGFTMLARESKPAFAKMIAKFSDKMKLRQYVVLFCKNNYAIITLSYKTPCQAHENHLPRISWAALTIFILAFIGLMLDMIFGISDYMKRKG